LPKKQCFPGIDLFACGLFPFQETGFFLLFFPRGRAFLRYSTDGGAGRAEKQKQKQKRIRGTKCEKGIFWKE
jgi:hypothetical protein